MNTARQFHTATLLRNGQVLVAGGYGPPSLEAVASAELYDPATGVWTMTGSMSTARGAHTATLLDNGQVLVAGAETASGQLASAELYDPATATWSATGSMNTARGQHTATLLDDGQVLVAGGLGPDGFAGATAELFSPPTDPTSTSVSCSPGTVAVGASSTCTVTVTDTGAGSVSTPTGTVSFGSSGPGSFDGNPCTLIEASSGVASCSVSYVPGATGTPTRSEAITATYGGDTTHAGSSGTTTVTVQPTTRADCQHGGWQNYGFQNQRDCVQFVNGGLGAPPPSKADCLHGGWRNHGFASQGDCVSFVATTGKNEPGKNVPTPRET
jgi:hypothetical protein